MDDPKRKDEPATQEERMDEGLDETFPASDPPAHVREPLPAEKERQENDRSESVV